MQIPVYNISGEEIEKIEVSDALFAVPFNETVVHQALVRQQANARVGTANTKTRGEVSGSTRKLYKQKGTGRARQGDDRAPHRRGGGVAFGPKPRSFHQAMPKKMRRLALRSVISSKVADGSLKVVDNLAIEKPSTKEMARILNNLKVDTSALVVTDKSQPNVYLSVGNLPKIKAMPAHVLNVADLLSHNMLVMTVPAVRESENLWAELKSAEGENSASI